jgi:protein SCO1/2
MRFACTSVGLVVLLAGCSHHYRATGIVLAVNRDAGEVTISHREVPGHMPAMAMPFRAANPADLAPLAPGARVRFELNVRRAGTYISKIRIDSGPPPDFPMPKPEHAIAIGGEVPGFTLIDEQGRLTRLADFRGRLVAIDFIYTRCPLPDVCPRLSANFALLQKKFGPSIVLLSITIDPGHDTPEVLREYAARWRADSKMWHFLTGPSAEIQKIAGYFGLVYFAEEGSITHTSSTALVAPDGRLAARLEGSGYTARQLADLVSAKMPRGSQP